MKKEPAGLAPIVAAVHLAPNREAQTECWTKTTAIEQKKKHAYNPRQKLFKSARRRGRWKTKAHKVTLPGTTAADDVEAGGTVLREGDGEGAEEKVRNVTRRSVSVGGAVHHAKGHTLAVGFLLECNR